MSSENWSQTFRPVTVAPKGTPCGWTAYGETGTRLTCQGGRDAIHILTVTLPVAVAGTALCGYHSPWDPTDAEREAVGQPFQTKAEAGADRIAAEILSRKLIIGDVLVDVTPEGTARVTYKHLSDSWISGTDEVTGESVSWRPSALLGWLESGAFAVVCEGTVSDTAELKELYASRHAEASGVEILTMSSDEDMRAASVPVVAVVTGEGVRKVADMARLMAYRTWGQTGMMLARNFRPTVKGWNAEHGQGCRTRAEVGIAAEAMIKAIRADRDGGK